MVKKALRLISIFNLSILLLIVVPFNNIYASTQSQIVPTFSSTTSQWNTHLSVTNFSDGTNNQASSTLSFTFDDDYYGMIYFDGYGPSNQHIANYAVCFVAGGYGEYRYSYYQNGVINITSVTIQIVNVVKPQSTVDLTQIITLLTAIENDTSSIDNVLDTTLAQIRLILAELIESNGYLETLTKLRQWNVPIESFSYVVYFMNNFSLSNTGTNYYEYPLFDIKTGDEVICASRSNVLNRKFIWIFGINKNVWDANSLGNYITYNNVSLSNIEIMKRMDSPWETQFTIVKATLNNDSTDTSIYRSVTFKQNVVIMPIFSDYEGFNNVSTDFALRYGLNNQLLEDLHLIANGTNASSAASSQNDQANSQLQQDSNALFTQEDSFKQNMNSAMQNIDTTFTLNNFGNSFMTSAQWVRTQYERLTNNTPFASLITFSLLVGLALIVVGKVYK